TRGPNRERRSQRRALVSAAAEQELLEIRERGPEPGDEEQTDDQARDAGDRADDPVEGAEPLGADEPGGTGDGDQGVRDEQADDERREDDDALGAGHAGDAREQQGLRTGLGADAVDHSDAERGLRSVLRRVRDRLVLMTVDPRLEPVPRVPDAVEDEPPPAPHAEL